MEQKEDSIELNHFIRKRSSNFLNLLDQDSYQNLDKNVKTKETSTDDMSISNIYDSKKKIYHQSLKWFSVFMLYGIIGGIFINAISKVKLLNFDMMFNILISPIIYYHSPRNILTKISLKQFIIFYTIPFILGLFFRFFDEIPILNNFILDPDDIKTTGQIVLLVLIIIGILLISFMYIYISDFPIINIILVTIHFLVSFISMYIFYQSGGKIHIHHYFLALCIMLLSRNPYSNIVNIIHGFAYGVYIEGISKWGIDPLFW